MFLFRFVKWIIDHPKFFIRRQLARATVSLFELLLLLNFFLFFFHIRKVLNCYKCLFVVLMLQNYDFFSKAKSQNGKIFSQNGKTALFPHFG